MSDLAPITMQDVRLRAGEGPLAPHDVLAAVNAVLRSRASAPPVGEGGWQPIETAPKDGTEFQAWLYGDPHPAAARFANGWWEPRCRFDPESGAIQVWGRIDYDQEGWEDYYPTRLLWMPLPSPPAFLSPGEP